MVFVRRDAWCMTIGVGDECSLDLEKRVNHEITYFIAYLCYIYVIDGVVYSTTFIRMLL